MLRSDPNAHKNEFGHVLVIAGSEAMLGAAALVSLAAMRAGAGLVTCAVPRHLNLTLQKKLSPVIMTLPLPGQTFSKASWPQLLKHWPKFDAIAIGPGMGTAPGVQAFIRQVLRANAKPVVIDADGLNALVQYPHILKKHPGIAVLTPHAGEMARLAGQSRQWVEKNRKAVAQSVANAYSNVVLLKGHRTLIVSPEGQTSINRTGNSGMATAGSGDVLTGVIAALLGQGLTPLEAAKLGAFWHGKAGDLAARRTGKASLIATDIIAHLPQVLSKQERSA